MRSVQLCDSVYDAGRGGRGFCGDHDLHELQLGWSCQSLATRSLGFPSNVGIVTPLCKGGCWALER